MDVRARQPDRPGYRPLYQQVRELLLTRIASGVWRPAEALPSEQALALELGVSQGTVRKALDSLAADSLLDRRQGKGTYVSQHTAESAQFRFFRVASAKGERLTPASSEASIVRREAKPVERERLGLGAGEDVYIVRRDRLIEEAPTLRETIALPASLFPALETYAPLPNALYTLYQARYGVSIVTASEQIRAVAASREDAAALGLDAGAPILEIDRIASDITSRPIEFRQTRFATEKYVYAIDLG